MAYIELIIKINDELYDEIKNKGQGKWHCREMDNAIRHGTPIPKGHGVYCKNCKWWKDSDGAYRRGAHAESQCPINTKVVCDGLGYCYMFEPQESEDEE